MIRFNISDRGRFSHMVGFDGWEFDTAQTAVQRLQQAVPSDTKLIATYSVGEDAALLLWTDQGVCLGTLDTA